MITYLGTCVIGDVMSGVDGRIRSSREDVVGVTRVGWQTSCDKLKSEQALSRNRRKFMKRTRMRPFDSLKIEIAHKKRWHTRITYNNLVQAIVKAVAKTTSTRGGW